ncbi:MAG: hypothetical protein HYV28_11780 [Ignavibacteriales bacterium]|nr:hypothetical protein [Ignavibacteriales bacterium]
MPEPLIVQVKKKLPLTALLIAVLVIWGMILMHVYKYFQPGDDDGQEQLFPDETISGESVTSQQPKPDLTYTKLHRNPFKFINEPVEVPVQNITSKEIKRPDFTFHISGVIINNNRRVVIIEDDSHKKTVFLREAESYLDLKIITISQNAVAVKQGSESRTIEIR